jgi:hypothetical protein
LNGSNNASDKNCLVKTYLAYIKVASNCAAIAYLILHLPLVSKNPAFQFFPQVSWICGRIFFSMDQRSQNITVPRLALLWQVGKASAMDSSGVQSADSNF